jgi:aspartate aminotransferase-like enzyme
LGEKRDYFYKIASHKHEFDQIHRLNYQTFSEEIPQHQKNEQEILIDSFHNENTYIICVKGMEIVGMIAVRDNRPFSLDKKIGPVEESLPIKVNKICELRLLAVKKEHRHGRVFLGLAQFIAKYCLKKGYDTAVISGTVRQLKLYNQMGFKPFSSSTGTNDARFQPLYLTKFTFDQSLAGRILQPTIPFLPGPVRITEKVRDALCINPISHRSDVFSDKLITVKTRLCKIVKSKYVQILLGSGTLANDCIAAQLSLEKGEGLILVNGEFGNRLVEQAHRQGLRFNVMQKEWGVPFTKEEIEKVLTKETTWLWAVHSETSTGMLNNVTILKDISKDKKLKLCLDCISSIGAVDIDLNDVFLASGVSGKAIGAYTGLSFVFHHHEVKPSSNLPKYLDIGFYMEKDSIPFSHSSNLLEALLVATEDISPKTYEKIKEIFTFLYNELTSKGFHITTSKQVASPIIITIEFPTSINSFVIGENLYFQGYQLHYESYYLDQRNWIQIACLGEHNFTDLVKMVHLLSEVYRYELQNCQITS